MRCAAARARQRGQAMTELAVALPALVALALGWQLLFRLQDIQRQTMAAAREATQSAAWNAVPVDTEAGRQRSHALHLNHAGWTDPTGATPLLEGPAQLEVAAGNERPAGLAGSTQDALLAPLRVVGGFLGAEFDLDERGVQAATVTTRLPTAASGLPPFDTMELQFQETSAWLGDAWNSGGPAHVAQRTRGLVPTGFLASQRQWLQPVLWPATFIEPALGRLCLGLVEPDRVPDDRLEPASAPLAQPGEAGCR